MEIKELEIDLNVEGWKISGGRSGNVWGQVSTENIPFEIIKQAVKKGKKSCIWTALDSVLYVEEKKKDFDKTDSYSRASHKDKEQAKIVLNKNLLKTMSATFKPSFDPYNSIAENMGMRIAVALDMPTSYNYLVKFDKNKYPQILKNFQSESSVEKVRDIGAVSLDFLQVVELDREIEEEVRVVYDGKPMWKKIKRNYSGDELVLFSESIGFARRNELLSGTNFSIKNWILGVDALAQKYVSEFPPELLQDQLKKINSRIVRSYLLREFLGDCDFTDLNSGFVINRDAQTIRYAPNFDYGESFNALIKTKLDYMPAKKELETILKWQPDYIEKKKERAKTPISIIAQTYASDASRANLRFVFENYPEDAKEFLQNLNEVAKSGIFNQIVDSYQKMTNNGKPLLNAEEASMFKEYIKCRTEWINTIASHYLDETKNEKTKDN